jgi:hypothetical protein
MPAAAMAAQLRPEVLQVTDWDPPIPYDNHQKFRGYKSKTFRTGCIGETLIADPTIQWNALKI